jgi:hypothetical protein
LGTLLISFQVSFKYSFNIALLVALFPKARANPESIARCDLDSFSIAPLLMLVVSYSIRGARPRVL